MLCKLHYIAVHFILCSFSVLESVAEKHRSFLAQLDHLKGGRPLWQDWPQTFHKSKEAFLASSPVPDRYMIPGNVGFGYDFILNFKSGKPS